MNSTMRRWAWAAMAITAMVAGGCQDKLKAENEALWKENQELHEELKTTRTALDSSNLELTRLQAELVAKQTPTKPGTGVAGDPYAGLEGAGVSVERGVGSVTVRVAGDVLFDSGKATLKETVKRKLRDIASAVNQNPNQRIRVEGHTDSDPIRKSSWRDNYHLAEARATAVRDYLASQGVSQGRMSIVGHGADKPVATNNTAGGKSQNRRVEIIIMN